jgi:hypothetical protein
MTRDRLFIAAALFLTAVAAGAALLVRLPYGFTFSEQATEAAMMVCGMLLMALLARISAIPYTGRPRSVKRVAFDEPHARQVLGRVTPPDYTDFRDPVPAGPAAKPVTTDDLFGQDPALALAKLRIDIESELRRIASIRGLKTDNYAMTARFLVDLLADRHFLPPELTATIRTVLPVCEQAIHGGAITADVARSVLNVGAELLTMLRLTD